MATGFMGLGGEEMPVVAEEPIVTTTETAPVVTEPVTPVVIPEGTTTPAATTEPVVADPPAPEIREVIKEVEKIVEKYPEMDDYTKELFDALMEGKEDTLLAYLSEKHKNYATMSDYDVIAESLKKANPKWNSERIELEIEAKYGEKLARIDLKAIDADLEPEAYAQALSHNKEVERNEKILKAHAFDARIALDEGKKEIKLPKIDKQVETNTGPTPEQVAQQQAEWVASVEAAVPNLSEFTFKVGDKENGYEDVSYKVTDAEKTAQLEFMKGFNLNTLAAKLGWIDKDGKPDILKAAGDVLQLEKMSTIISSAYTQGRTAGTKGTVAEIKNIDLGNKRTEAVITASGDLNPFSHLNPK